MDGSVRARAALNLRCIAVITKAGLVRPRSPVRTIRGARAMRALGPIAGGAAVGVIRDPDAIGLVDDAGSLTFGQLDRRTNALARALQQRGVGGQSVIGLLARNHRGNIETMIAAGKLGATIVPLNTGTGEGALIDVIRRERVSVLVYDAEFAEFAELVAAVDPVPRFLSDASSVSESVNSSSVTLERLIADTDDAPLPPPASAGRIILLTSGTGGTPKGAPRAISKPLAVAQFLDRIPLRAGERTCVGTPLFHGTGMSQMIMTFALGSTVVLTRRFEAIEMLRTIERHRVTALILVPTTLQRLVDARERDASDDVSSLRLVLVSGAPLSPQLVVRTQAAFGDVLYNMYGGTEASVVAVARPDDLRQNPATVGLPPVGCEIALFDDADHRIVAPHVTGRIYVSSILAFDGYTDGQYRPTIDGMLSTGDLGHFDVAGRLFIDGREDDMILSGAENVYPIEIENLLLTHPDVADAAAVGVHDDEFGQRVAAYVVPRESATIDVDELKEYVRLKLARYKVPKQITVVAELPRNAAGKLLRAQMAEWSPK